MEVIHRFNLLSARDQKKKACSFLFNMILLNAIIFFLAWSINWMIIRLIQPILSVFASFIVIPMARKREKLLCFSSSLSRSALKNNKMQLHGGTLFDYYYTLSIGKSEGRNRNIILYSYLDDLLNFLKNFSMHPDNIIIQAKAYLINPSNAALTGFKIFPNQFISKIIIRLHYFPITSSYSPAVGNLSFPSTWHLISYVCHLGELRKNQPKLEIISKQINR